MIASVALWRDREQKQQYLTILLKTKASGKKAARIWQQNGNAAVLSRETDGLKIRWAEKARAGSSPAIGSSFENYVTRVVT